MLRSHRPSKHESTRIGAVLMPQGRALAVSILLTLPFCALQAALHQAFEAEPLAILFVIPILASAYVGGLRPGLVSTAIVAVAYLAAGASSAHSGVLAAIRLALLVVSGALISLLVDALHRSRRDAFASQTRLAAVVGSADDAILTVDAAQRVTFFNAAAERIFGHRAEEIVGQPLSRLIPARAHATHAATARAFLDDGTTRRMTGGLAVTGMRADGTEFPAEISIARVTVGGEVLVTAIVRDITDRERLQADLLASEERFAQLFRMTPAGTMLLRLRDRTVVDLNDAFTRITGYTRDDLVGEDFTGLGVAVDRAVVSEMQASIAAGRRHSCPIHAVKRKDGSPGEASLTAEPAHFGGEDYAIVVLEDMTQQRALESQLRQAQKMESLGLLAGGIAHDFNNLLAVVLAAAEMLDAGLPGPEHAELVGEIRGAADRAVGLTRQLLAFSRHSVVEPKTVDVNALIIDAEKMLRRILGEDIEVHVALAAGAGKVVVDPGLFGQVLLNLGVNARDAMPRGGRFVVQTADVDLAQGDLDDLPAVRPGRYVLVSVADTGVGMAQDVMARVFEPFFTTKGVGRGSGLGLSVVHGIISQSGGHIRLDSERDKGTTFAFYLPAAEDLPPVRRTESDLPARSGDETLLVVEDEDAVRRAARRALSTRGYTVLEASSGEGALDVLRERGGEVDLLFTDVVMPRMDGRQLADAVRARYPSVRVLFTSGYTDDAVTRHGIETGEVAFVQKPYTIEALLRRVRAVLDHP